MPPRRGLEHRVVFTEVISLATRVDPVVAHALSDILAHCGLIQAHRTYTVAARPKVVPGQIFAFAKIPAVDQDG